MYTLSKHKRRGTDGFKDFVRNLELFPSETVDRMIFLGLLEDPVYLRHALKNRISFEYFTSLEVDDVLKVYRDFKSRIKLFVMALKNTEYEDQFLRHKIPRAIAVQYKEESSVTPVTKSQQDAARIRIMESCLKLEKKRDLAKINWELPPPRVVDGEIGQMDDKGNYVLRYLDGTLALKGPLENRLRAGFWKHYYPNGKLIAEGIYLNGEKNDHWVFYYPNGAKKSEGQYKEDRQHGKWEEYDREGNVEIVNYIHGKKG